MNKPKWIDTGYSMTPRVFQLVVENEFEPEIIIVFAAGKAINENEMNYHVVKENGYGDEPNGDYSILKQNELEKLLGFELDNETENDLVDKIKSGEIKPQLCCFSDALTVINVSEDTFGFMASMITNKPVDYVLIENQKYFSVMTNIGLIILKKIIK